MKTTILITTAILFFVFTNAGAQNVTKESTAKTEIKTTAKGPVAKFDKTEFDFPDLTQNSPGTASFTLTNDGNEPLIISSATASCGCTNLTYSKDPILPAKSITISVTYNAAAVGNFIKSVTVRTNASEQPVILQIKGKVVAKS